MYPRFIWATVAVVSCYKNVVHWSIGRVVIVFVWVTSDFTLQGPT